MKHNKHILLTLLLTLLTIAPASGQRERFVRVEGASLIQPDGRKLFIRGTNLGNWLNPEGYMFGFERTNCEWMIDGMLSQMVGPDAAADFWQAFKDAYITRADIAFIAAQGANTVRLPFNYKLFTDEDYMGLTAHQDGFARVDSVVRWCRELGLYLILDMHDCPGGQTGDNIDNGYGYPWLFESERSQQLFCDIWLKIAQRYADEPTILGYELMNEPIAHYFDNKEELNLRLEPLYKRAVGVIRAVDKNHVILLGGAQWNSNFQMFQDWTFDDNIMFTCHRYGGPATAEAINDFIGFRDKTHLPMLMGELGHNTDQWQADFAAVMRQHDIGYTFWPYKKVDGSCMMAIERPADWDSLVVKYSEAPRGTFREFREARPDQSKARQALAQFIENCRFSRCIPQTSYIESMRLKAE